MSLFERRQDSTIVWVQGVAFCGVGVACIVLMVPFFVVLFLSIYPSIRGTPSAACLANGNKGAWSVTMPFVKRGLHRDFRVDFTLVGVAYYSAPIFSGTGRFCCLYCSLPGTAAVWLQTGSHRAISGALWNDSVSQRICKKHDKKSRF